MRQAPTRQWLNALIQHRDITRNKGYRTLSFDSQHPLAQCRNVRGSPGATKRLQGTPSSSGLLRPLIALRFFASLQRRRMLFSLRVGLLWLHVFLRCLWRALLSGSAPGVGASDGILGLSEVMEAASLPSCCCPWRSTSNDATAALCSNLSLILSLQGCDHVHEVNIVRLARNHQHDSIDGLSPLRKSICHLLKVNGRAIMGVLIPRRGWFLKLGFLLTPWLRLLLSCQGCLLSCVLK